MAERHDVIMTGIGGKGVLTAGLLLAQAGMGLYKNVLWFPSYQAAMRGGPCECTIILSDEEIASPILSQAQALIVMEPSQLKPFEHRVQPKGLLLIEKAGLSEGVERGDVKVIPIPAVEMALQSGDSQVANLIFVGAYIGLTGVIPLEMVERELEDRFKGKALTINKRALRQGAEFTVNKPR
jgi:2-oxoglutarate ferredoxin oxidoreductase subunit gamma